MKSPLHIAALKWAAAGYYVHPILPGRKEPASANGLHDATLDPAQIDTWWAVNPDFNIGCAPGMSGDTVLDVDPPLGETTLRELELAEHPLPATLTISTPRGGRHLWFSGLAPSSSNKLGPKLDTRGTGGYVLLPPSVIAPYTYDNNPTGGNYGVKEAQEAADLPEWIGRRLALERSSHVAATGDVDTPENIGRVRSTLMRLVTAGDVAIEGSGGDDRTFRLACEMLDLGVSPETGLELAAELWNPHCSPPWSGDELRIKFDNAAQYRQNDVGAYAVRSAAETFSHIRVALGDNDRRTAHETGRSRFYPLDLTEQAQQAEPSWLIPNLIPADGLVICYGRPKSFKSFLMLDLCLGIAAGEETFGFKPASGAVVYAAGEGSHNISRKHVPAWRIARQRADDFPFYVVPCVPRVIDSGQTEELVAQIKERGIKPAIVVIDTVARSTGGLEENSARDIGVFIAACDYIREQLRCTVIGIHHSGKDSGRGSRGSNALEGAVDTVLEVERHKKSATVALMVREQRSAQERDEPYTFQGHVVGPSLVFDPTSLEAYHAVLDADQLISAKKIGAVLQTLQAYGYDKGVSSAVLAAELGRGVDVSVAELTKELHKARKKVESVAMLCDGTPLRWHLLAPDSDK